MIPAFVQFVKIVAKKTGHEFYEFNELRNI